MSNVGVRFFVLMRMVQKAVIPKSSGERGGDRTFTIFR